MKALVKTKFGPDCMRFMDVPEPTPGADDIKVKVFACGVCGTDIHLLHDQYASIPPVITGHEFSGFVSEVGANVTDFQVGDRVVTMTAVETCEHCEWCRLGLRMFCPERKSVGTGRDGGFAEYVILPAKHAFHIPQGVSMTAAALSEPLACVVRCVCEHSTIKAGDFVLVSGAGVMGQITAQVAKANGGVVIMTGLKQDEKRFALAKELGVFATVYVDEEDAMDKILELTGGAGPRVAYECAGAAASADFCIRALEKTGQFVQIAIPGKPIMMNMDMLLYKGITVTNGFASERSSWRIALQLLGQNMVNMEPFATSILPLEQWEEGFRRTQDKEDFKVLLMPNNADLETVQ